MEVASEGWVSSEGAAYRRLSWLGPLAGAVAAGANALVYPTDGEEPVIVGSGGGVKEPFRVSNLEANPEAVVQLGCRRGKVWVAGVEGEERNRLWSQLTGMFPRFAGMQREAPRGLPLVALRPAGRVGPVTDRGRWGSYPHRAL